MRLKSIKFTYFVWLALVMGNTLSAQDLEPRRWTPLPAGTTVVGVTYGHNSGDVGFDPVLEIEDTKVKRDFLVMSYTHFFTLAEKLMRFDALLPLHKAKWDGLLSGELASAERTGLADPHFRLSVNLLGAPTSKFKVSNDSKEAQIGVVHTRGPWSYELTGSIFFFTDNDNFFNGNELEQKPFYAAQAHIIRLFDLGVWGSLSAGYGQGGASKVNSVSKDDEREGFISALSLGIPLTDNQGLKFSYVWAKTQTDTETRSKTDTYFCCGLVDSLLMR
jgi:hypothetical protein